VFSGDFMRAGFVTWAAALGIEERIFVRQTRHRSTAVVRRYIREGELFAGRVRLDEKIESCGGELGGDTTPFRYLHS
jgi:hypothetical protein